VIIAAVLYFLIVTPMNRIAAKLKTEEKSVPAPVVVPEDVALLKEIRDLLKASH